MEDINNYRIELRGRVDEDDLNATSPIALTVEKSDKDTTQMTVTTDQSGLIGMLRHLHARGLELLSVTCNPQSETILG